VVFYISFQGTPVLSSCMLTFVSSETWALPKFHLYRLINDRMPSQ
jgi:hypothetical protein